MRKLRLLVWWVAILAPAWALAAKDNCLECHGKANPKLVADWRQSRMAMSGMGCADCHGRAHTGPENTDRAVRPAIKACEPCHGHQAKRFRAGKHGLAETALHVSAMGKKVKHHAPTVFDRSCATCHNGICRDGGKCDACHAGHRFSAVEARKPEACLPCHMGNHPQYEAYGNSKHGALYRTRGLDGSVPTCSTCHMAGGDHMVKTSWGFFGVRGEEPDEKNRENQAAVMEALEMLGPVLAPDSYRTTLAEWQSMRKSMVAVCAGCHPASSARAHLAAGDRIVHHANQTAAGFLSAAKALKAKGEYTDEAYFWLVRDKMHAQRMSMYIDAFHQFPEGILLEMIHFKRETMALKEKRHDVAEKMKKWRRTWEDGNEKLNSNGE